MSLETKISDLVKSSDELTTAVRGMVHDIDTNITGKLNSLDSKTSKFVDNWGIEGYTVLEVGPTRKFKSIRAAWDSLNGKVLKSDIKIKVDDGVHDLNRLNLYNQPYAHRIRIEGNISKPENCVLKFVPDSKGFSHGILIRNVQELWFSGFTLVGEYNDNNCTYRLLNLEESVVLYSEPNSIVLDTARDGVQLFKGAVWNASGVKISGIALHAINCNCSIAMLDNLTVVGSGTTPTSPAAQTNDGNMYSVGILCADNAVIHSRHTKISEVSDGVRCGTNGYLYSPNIQVSNATKGLWALWGGIINAITTTGSDETRVSNAIEGYVATDGGIIRVDSSIAEHCTIGFHSKYYGSRIICENSTAIDCESGYLADYGAHIRAYHTKAKAKNCTTLYNPAQSPTMDANGNLLQHS